MNKQPFTPVASAIFPNKTFIEKLMYHKLKGITAMEVRFTHPRTMGRLSWEKSGLDLAKLNYMEHGTSTSEGRLVWVLASLRSRRRMDNLQPLNGLRSSSKQHNLNQ